MEDLIKPELKQAPLNVSQEFELKDITAPIFQDYKFNLSKEASNWEFWKANFFGFGGSLLSLIVIVLVISVFVKLFQFCCSNFN